MNVEVDGNCRFRRELCVDRQGRQLGGLFDYLVLGAAVGGDVTCHRGTRGIGKSTTVRRRSTSKECRIRCPLSGASAHVSVPTGSESPGPRTRLLDLAIGAASAASRPDKGRTVGRRNPPPIAKTGTLVRRRHLESNSRGAGNKEWPRP